jgi:hypothetical protein
MALARVSPLESACPDKKVGNAWVARVVELEELKAEYKGHASSNVQTSDGTRPFLFFFSFSFISQSVNFGLSFLLVDCARI